MPRRRLREEVQAVVMEAALNRLVGTQLATVAVVTVDITTLVLVEVIVSIAGNRLPSSLFTGKPSRS